MASPLGSPRALWNETTLADRIVSIGMIVVAFALAGSLRIGARPPDHAVVRVGDTEVATLDLTTDVRRTIDGRTGPVTLEVADGAVRIVASDCPQKLCIAMGAKHRAGEMIACVPQGVVVRLEGGTPDPDVPDAVTR